MKDFKIEIQIEFTTQKNFNQLFGDVNTILYLCTQSFAPIVERKILFRKVLYFKKKWSVYEHRRSIYLRVVRVCERRRFIC